jgi:hypothetical protein
MADEQADDKAPVTVEEKIDRLTLVVTEGFAAVDQRFVGVDERFVGVDERLDAIDRRFVAVEERFAAVDAAFVEQRQYTEFAFERLSNEMKGGFDGISRRLVRLERKLDGFIDTQAKTNELVERRLDALEGRSGGPT